MNREEAEEYTQALGQVMAGGWRHVLLGQRLGVPAALGLSTPEWVERRLGGYVKMSVPERQEAVKELTAPVEQGGNGLSARKAAEVLGVSHETVANDSRPVRNLTEVDQQQSNETPNAVRNLTQPQTEPLFEPPQLLSDSRKPAPETDQSVLDRVMDAAGDDDGKVAKARLKAAVSSGVRDSHELFRLRPDSVADVLNDGDYAALRVLEQDAIDWFEAIHTARSRNLHLVGA